MLQWICISALVCASAWGIGCDRVLWPSTAPMVYRHEVPTPGAPTYVLVHGLTEDLFSLMGIAERLVRAGKNALVIDLHGHGRSLRAFLEAGGRLPPHLRFESQVDDLVTVFEQLGLSGLHLIGHSYGGAVVLAAAERLGTQVRSLELLAPYVMRLDAYIAERFIPMPLFLRSSQGLRDAMADHSIVWNSLMQLGLAAHITEYTRVQHEAPLSGFEIVTRAKGAMAAIRGCRQVNFLTDPPRLRRGLPVRLWIAGNDSLIPRGMLEAFATTLHGVVGGSATTLRLSGASHTFPREIPREVTERLLTAEATP